MSEGIKTSEVATNSNLYTLIENSLIGSSIDYKGSLYNTDDIERGIKDGSLGRDLYVPTNVLNGATDLDTALLERKKRKYISGGILPSFELDYQLDLDSEGLSPALELPEIDKDSGLIPASWKVRLLTEKGEIVEDKDKLAKLKLVEKKKKQYNLAFNENEELILSFHP